MKAIDSPVFLITAPLPLHRSPCSSWKAAYSGSMQELATAALHPIEASPPLPPKCPAWKRAGQHLPFANRTDGLPGPGSTSAAGRRPQDEVPAQFPALIPALIPGQIPARRAARPELDWPELDWPDLNRPVGFPALRCLALRLSPLLRPWPYRPTWSSPQASWPSRPAAYASARRVQCERSPTAWLADLSARWSALPC